MTPPRPEIRYQRVRDHRGEEPEEEGEEELSIYLYSQPSSLVFRQRYRETCFRIFSSILLLVVAAGFVWYGHQSRNTEASTTQPRFLVLLDESTNGNHSGAPPSLTIHEDPGESPHHHHHDPQTSHHEEDEDEVSSPDHNHSEGTFHQAAAITDSETCSMLARDVLQSGGSVVDAGISAVLCLVVVHPHTTSLGGVFSSIYFDGASRSSAVLNAIPRQASPVSYGVPQVLQGLWVLHQTYGRKPWVDLVSAAAILAREGFLVDSSLHAALMANYDKVRSSEGLCSLFCDSHQEPKDVGERVKNPTLGKLLEQIASSISDPALPDQIIHSMMKDIEVTDREKFLESSSRPVTIEDPQTLHLDTMTLLTTGGLTAGNILSNSIQKISKEKLNGSSESIAKLLLDSSKQTYALGGARPGEWASSFPLAQNLAPVGSNVLIADTSGDIFILALTLNSTFGSGFVSTSTGILLSDFVQGQDSTHNSSLLYWACPSVLIYGADNDVMGLSAYGGSSGPFSMAQVIISHLLLEMDLTQSVTGSLVEVPPGTSDPWMEYFGLQGNGAEPVVAVEVQAEHVHVKKSHGLCCYPSGH